MPVFQEPSYRSPWPIQEQDHDSNSYQAEEEEPEINRQKDNSGSDFSVVKSGGPGKAETEHGGETQRFHPGFVDEQLRFERIHM
jgi:hypothetical protein